MTQSNVIQFPLDRIRPHDDGEDQELLDQALMRLSDGKAPIEFSLITAKKFMLAFTDRKNGSRYKAVITAATMEDAQEWVDGQVKAGEIALPYLYEVEDV